MKAISTRFGDDFMQRAGVPMPDPVVPGALPATVRETVPASLLNMLVDVAMIWTLGDFPSGNDCSLYFDPASPWYNVIYGAYGLRSHKRDGSAWGFNLDGSPNWDEFFQVSAVDYNFLTAGQFGCPPNQMTFEIHSRTTGIDHGWFYAQTVATIPSGLHDFRATLGNPEAYLLYGIPSPAYLTGGHQPYEPVAMRGHVFLRQMTFGPYPISLAWGVTCPDTPAGNALRGSIITALAQSYLPLAPMETPG